MNLEFAFHIAVDQLTRPSRTARYETLLERRVAIITINRPDKRNALNIKTREEGAALLEELRNDDSVGVVVFTGAGDKAFIAGADIAEFAGRTSITQRDVMMGRSLFTAIDTFSQTRDRDDQWLLSGWWLRIGAGLRHSHRQRDGFVWSTGNQSRNHSRWRRHATSDASGW